MHMMHPPHSYCTQSNMRKMRHHILPSFLLFTGYKQCLPPTFSLGLRETIYVDSRSVLYQMKRDIQTIYTNLVLHMHEKNVSIRTPSFAKFASHIPTKT